MASATGPIYNFTIDANGMLIQNVSVSSAKFAKGGFTPPKHGPQGLPETTLYVGDRVEPLRPTLTPYDAFEDPRYYQKLLLREVMLDFELTDWVSIKHPQEREVLFTGFKNLLSRNLMPPLPPGYFWSLNYHGPNHYLRSRREDSSVAWLHIRRTRGWAERLHLPDRFHPSVDWTTVDKYKSSTVETTLLSDAAYAWKSAAFAGLSFKRLLELGTPYGIAQYERALEKAEKSSS